MSRGCPGRGRDAGRRGPARARRSIPELPDRPRHFDSSPTDRLVARLNGTAETASCGDAVDRMVSLRRSAFWSCHFWRLRVTDPADIRGRDAHRIPGSYFRHDIGHGITAGIGAAVRRAISVVRRTNRRSRKRTFFALATIFALLKRLQAHGTATDLVPDDRPRQRHHRNGRA